MPENTNIVPAAATAAPVSFANANVEIFDAEVLRSLMAVADVMSKSGVAVPAWARNNPGGCLSVCILARQHRMNPFGLIADSYSVEGGIPSYGAKATHAIVESACGSTFEHEFFGDWTPILGNVVEKTNGQGKKYYAPGWNKLGKEEDGLGVRIWLKSAPDRKMELLLKQCITRNSTNWANNPQQQLFYQACKVYARMYHPGAVLGVYSTDELDDDRQPINITPAASPAPAAQETAKTEALKERLGVKQETPAADAEVVLTMSQRIAAAIEESNAGITLAEVEQYMVEKGLLQGYGIDDFNKYPATWRRILANDVSALVVKVGDWKAQKAADAPAEGNLV